MEGDGDGRKRDVGRWRREQKRWRVMMGLLPGTMGVEEMEGDGDEERRWVL